MAKLCLKKPSKRQPARRRYKIEKKIREHNRKKRKEAKRLEGKAPKKLIHVPNICPFKEDILKAADEYKKHRELVREQEREKAKAAKVAAKTLTELVEIAEEKQINQEKSEERENLIRKKIGDLKSKTYYREFQKVVAASDVILEVVDARDPIGTRCPTVEQLVRDSGEQKRLVLILNKSDLVPRENLDKWLKYLRHSLPAIPFKSSTQVQGKRLGRRKLKKGETVRSGAICMGAEGLTSLLANYTRNKGVKTSIRVGVVGLPNVGKSSLINSLKRNRSCKVGAVPGVTRSLQEVSLDSKIKLLDSPGLALASSDDPSAVLKNSILTTDSIGASELIVNRAGVNQLKELYLVPSFNTTTEFLASLAKRFGKFSKGGVPDVQAAGQLLLLDWNRGKISYHTEPPVLTDNQISSTIIASNASVSEFDLDAYDKHIDVQNLEEEMQTNEEKLTEHQTNFVVTGDAIKKKRNKKNNKKDETIKEIEGSLRMKKINKLNEKKMRKLKKKNAKKEKDLSKTLEGISL